MLLNFICNADVGDRHGVDCILSGSLGVKGPIWGQAARGAAGQWL